MGHLSHKPELRVCKSRACGSLLCVCVPIQSCANRCEQKRNDLVCMPISILSFHPRLPMSGSCAFCTLIIDNGLLARFTPLAKWPNGHTTERNAIDVRYAERQTMSGENYFGSLEWILSFDICAKKQAHCYQLTHLHGAYNFVIPVFPHILWHIHNKNAAKKAWSTRLMNGKSLG